MKRRLAQLARERNLSSEAMMEQIDVNLHRLAITPEWQMLKTLVTASPVSETAP